MITRVAIDNDRVTWVALVLLLVAGVRAFLALPQAEDPGFTIRTALVVTHFPGASPERVELLVTDKLEKAIQEMPELDVVRSQSKTGVSLVTVDIQESYTEMRPIWDDLRRKVDGAVDDLPDSILGPFVNDEFGDVFGTLISLVGDGFDDAELKLVADEIRDELLLIDEVAKVEIHGAQDERVFVEYNDTRIAELGLSPTQLRAILESRNIISSGGEIRTADETIVLEPSGNFESVEELKRTILIAPGHRELLYLEDVAHVRRGYVDPPAVRTRISGEPGLVLAVSMREGGNIVTLGEKVRETVERLQGQYPHGIELGFSQFQAGAVEAKVDDFLGNLLQAVAIVIAVMLLSLGLRTGLVVASLIPMAIVMSFVFMGAFQIGIDQMSLASLIIALGMLVDNAIVMSESVMVQMSEGKEPRAAAIDSANELAVPLLTSSLTTAAAFLPIFLAESATGEYTAPLFKVVTITLLSSWVLSLTMVPLLCVRFLRVPIRESRQDGGVYRAYRQFLATLLRWRWAAVAVVVVLFAVALWGFRFVPALFFPPNDRPALIAELMLPVGTPLAKTEAMVLDVEQFVRDELMVDTDVGGVTDWATFVGAGAPRFFLSYGPEQSSPEYAILLINASTRPAVDEVVERLRKYCSSRFPGLRTRIQPLPSGPPATNPIEVRLRGRNPDVVFDLADQVKAKLRTFAGVIEITDDWGARSKKLVVEVNEARARRAGVTHQDIAVSLQTRLSGFRTTEFREGDKVIPVTLRAAEADRFDFGRLETLSVFSQSTGASVPLQQVADLRVEWQPSSIRRRDRLKTVTVEAGLESGVTAASVNAVLTPWLEELSEDWSYGYSWELGGEDENSREANASIAEQLPVAGLIIVLLLVGQFNSVRRPLIITATIPLGLIGVVTGLLVMRSYFGFMTLLGVISLSGIVINNAIVLLDRIRIEIEDNGRSPYDAVLESGQRRLRPILLTTATTLGGLLPLYLGGGAMWEPMAVAIMFGLVFATALTLGVVPVFYSILFRVRSPRPSAPEPPPVDQPTPSS